MGTAADVLRPHDCLAHARAAYCRRPLRPAGRRMAAAAARHYNHHHHHHHHQGQRHGDIARGSAAAAAGTAAPRQVRTKVVDAYAGPAFGAMSPSPRALPLPRLSIRTAAAAACAASEAPAVDDAATRELRRMLGLH